MQQNITKRDEFELYLLKKINKTFAKFRTMLDVNKLFYNEKATDDEPNGIDLASMIKAIEVIARMNNQSTFVVDFDKGEILFCSDNLIFIDESTPRDIKRDCANPYWSLISDETLGKLIMIRNNYPKVGLGISCEEYVKHVCTFDFPVVLKNRPFFITQSLSPLVLRNDGSTRIGLFTINHSTKKEIECTFTTSSGKRMVFDFSKSRFVECDFNVELTVMEKAILNRIMSGMSNESIALCLYLSVNTIKTHRQRIFKKLNVDNILEALAVITNYRLA